LRATIVANDGSGGRLFSSLVLKLDDAQLQALESLGSAKVLHVQSEDPALQTLLAKAVARTGPGQLRVQRLDGNSAEYAGHTISIHDDSTIVFEVRGQGPEDSECLEFVALRETTPILFPELRPNITEEVENGRFALPTSREESVDKEPDKRPLENALEVQRVVAELEADEAMREAIIDSLHSHLAAINEDVEGPKGRAFIERAVSNMELQAYGGDNRADRTMRLLLETIFSADQRLGVDQVQILGDSLVSLQKYSDRIYAAGEAWRTAHYPEA
jgi:hypothetical protein